MKQTKKNKQTKTVTLALSALSVAVSGALLASAYASDLEIYNHNTITPEVPTPSTPQPTQPISSNVKPVLMLVLNIGDGMGIEEGSFRDDYGHDIRGCVMDGRNPATSNRTETRTINFHGADGRPNGKKVSYKYETCKGNPTRVSVIKEAFLKFLANPNPQIQAYKERKKIDSPLNSIGDFKIGLASNFSMNGPNGGQILYPAVDMTDDNRFKMAQEIAKLDADNKGATPLALTIAETMAYFSGGTTATGNKVQTAYPVGLERRGAWAGECAINNPVRKLPNGKFDVQSACYRQDTSVTKEQAFAKYPTNIYNIIPVPAGSSTYYVAEFKEGTYLASGFAIAHPDSKSGNTYKSPLSKDNECAANGIYFLSDGDVFDVTGTSSSASPQLYLETLNKALGNQPSASIRRGSSNFCAGTLNDGSTRKHALGVVSTLPTFWSCAGEMAKYARAKFDSKGNIIRNQSFQVTKGGETFNADVRFASVGYGGGLKQAANARKSPVEVVLPGGTKKGMVDAYNCNSFTDARARNMCKLGEHGQGYGEGGFYYVAPNDNTAVAESVVNFMFSLTAQPQEPQTPEVVYPPADRTPTSTGAMTTPIDPLTGNRASGFAYLPILDPMPGVTTLWNGNLKKYNIKNSTMVGKNDLPVIKSKQGEFNTNTYDYWSRQQIPDQALPQNGGAYSQLFNPENLRNVWTDGKASNGTTMVQLTNNIDGALSSRSDKDILKPLLESFIRQPADESNKVLGGVLHSRPQLVAYEIGIERTGGLDPSTRKDAILYGSMDGSLHLVDDKTGKELFVFVPQEMLDLQPNALNKGSTNNGKVPHGVDGPWNVYTNYITNGQNRKIQASTVIASGGLRMGGSKYYSLDITDSSNPKHLYTVGSSYGKYLQDGSAITGSGGKTKAEDEAYARMGQSWAKPTIGYVRSGGKKIMVDFLAGGYDYGYENADYVPQGNAQGNAVYMVQVGEERINATTNQIEISPTNSGKLLWWATGGTGRNNSTASTGLQSSQHQEMNHSVVSQIRVLDRDNDGYTDHIYYADLGGRVWRADIDNTANADNFSVTRVVKVLDVSDQKAGDDTAPRFYERPLVTFTKEVEDETINAVVSVGSGNRSLPVSATRNKADAMYTFLDKDVTRPRGELYNTGTPLQTQNLKANSHLMELTFTENDKKIKTQMKAGQAQGWYYPLTKWIDTSGRAVTATGLKSFNEPDALDGYLFATVYNPSAIIKGAPTTPAPKPVQPAHNANDNKCGIPPQPAPTPVSGGAMKGVTQRVLMCLPFGNCATDLENPKPNDFSKIPSVDVGVGIIDNIITEEGGGGGDVGTLITQCTGDDCLKEKPNKLTGIPTSPDKLRFDITPTLNPRDWWEK